MVTEIEILVNYKWEEIYQQCLNTDVINRIKNLLKYINTLNKKNKNNFINKNNPILNIYKQLIYELITAWIVCDDKYVLEVNRNDENIFIDTITTIFKYIYFYVEMMKI